jgi:hypothetical protein
METTCKACGKRIRDLEIYGDGMCWEHHSELAAEYHQSYYGLAPHTHGPGIIGTTQLDYEATRRAIANDEFIPDPDAPGLGIWTLKGIGWK